MANGNVGNQFRENLHELAAALIGTILALAMAYCSITGHNPPGELTAALATVLGYFFGLGQARAQNGH